MGVERLLLLMREQQIEVTQPSPDVYLACFGEAATRQALQTAQLLRQQGMSVQMHCGGGSFKSQMRKADASGAAVALIIGDDEIAAGSISVKPLRGEGGQQLVAIDSLIGFIERMVG